MVNMRVDLIAMVVLVAACGSGPSTQSASETGAGSAAALGRFEFLARRDAICLAGSNDIADINDQIDGLSGQELADGFARIADRIRQAQSDLDALGPPEDAQLQAFVADNNARRSTRLELLGQLAAASVDDPSAMAEIDARLTALNVDTEREEDIHATLHCP